jgi:hypothetical protein
MNRIAIGCDDEEDTRLFNMLQEYVLTEYPDRIGCLESVTLATLVFAPESLDLSDAKFLHIFKCAECTRLLMTYREQKERWTKDLLSRDSCVGRCFRSVYVKYGMTVAMLFLLFSSALNSTGNHVLAHHPYNNLISGVM